MARFGVILSSGGTRGVFAHTASAIRFIEGNVARYWCGPRVCQIAPISNEMVLNCI
ncbi:MAG: hypothetical protein QF890_11850 [Myxococcota bacterium]|jgi:hypothetical protein|nr:hypothetical protein [bacterium]MDP6074008.1 hypothetical protein [Myxococcota bacterium]MDP6243199.1 hypothetical protein [Myxococcota bacterium]MDP7075566.1 hypothetical protein [Myxococcota bacterium]MDP7300474.1 hypothetical protein [Myxococcota bacterium]